MKAGPNLNNAPGSNAEAAQVVPRSNNTTAVSDYNANRRSVYNPAMSRGGPAQDQLTVQMGQFSLSTTPKLPLAGGQGMFNPSEGPSPSAAPGNWRARSRAPSQASGYSTQQPPIRTDIYVSSGKRRGDFCLGEVISLPFHQSNTNPQTNPADYHLGKTWLGPAFSKRRMMVVLFIFHESMFCLPLYSFSERGITARPEHIQKEYVCMKNVDDVNFVNDGLYPPVEVKARLKPLSPETTIQMTGGMRVSFDEEVANVGRLTQKSYRHLVRLWQGVNEQGMADGWKE